VEAEQDERIFIFRAQLQHDKAPERSGAFAFKLIRIGQK
jgi:hypothetical protein